MSKEKMEDAARLRKLFETVKNRAKFAREYDVPGGSSMIYQHINGITPIGMDAALAYMRGFGCRMEDISPSLAKKTKLFSEQQKEQKSPSEDEYSLVPILDVHAACGNGYFNDQAIVEGGFALPKVMLRELGIHEGQGRIIHANGNSMAPTIQDGAVVLINLADKEPKISKVYAVCLPHEGLVLKRLNFEYNEAAGTSVWIMKSDNTDKNQYPDRRLPPDESTIIVGRAVWYGNKL